MKTYAVVAIIAILIISFAAIALSKQSTTTPTATSSPTPSPTTNPTTMPSAAANPTDPADVATATQVVLSTTMGDITLNLYPQDAPLAVKNFVTLGKRGYYNGDIFHRVIKDFMIQTGDPTGTGTGGESIYGQYFKTEITSHEFVAGTLGGARTSAMDTNGSQFFITSVAYPSLNGQYTAFGQVADQASLDVVTKIDAVATDPSTDKPLQDVKITGFKIVK